VKLTTFKLDEVGGFSQVKRTIFLATLFAAALVILLSGCGDPAIGTLQSITLTAVTSNKVVEVKGEGGTLQLVATGNYSTHATKDLTPHVTYTAAPAPNSTDDLNDPLPATSATDPQTISISTTGLVTAVPPFVCTFENLGTATTPSWAVTGSYGIVATFNNITSNPVYVPVASAAGHLTADAGACGP
jgi:hypothetical protein